MFVFYVGVYFVKIVRLPEGRDTQSLHIFKKYKDQRIEVLFIFYFVVLRLSCSEFKLFRDFIFAIFLNSHS